MFSFKMIGILLIITSGGLLGLWQGDKLRLRQHTLEQCRFMLSSLRQTLIFTEDTPYYLIKRVSRMGELQGLDFLQTALTDETNFHHHWKNGVMNTMLPLKKEDKQLLLQIGEQLGSSDLDSQARYLALLEENLSEVTTHLRQENLKQIKLTQTLGVLLGVFMAILMI